MANTATAAGSKPIKLIGRGNVKQTNVVIDTTATDVTVITTALNAASAKKPDMTALVGMTSIEVDADVELQFSSLNPLDGTTKTVLGSLFIANGTMAKADINGSILGGICTLPGESLIVQSDTAITLYLHTITGPTFQVIAT